MTVGFSRWVGVAVAVLLFAACESSSVTTLEDSRSASGGFDPVEWSEGLARCLRAGGAEVDFLSPYGHFEAVAGSGMTEDAMAVLWMGCMEEAGPLPEYEHDPDFLRRVYAANLLIRDCLIDLGYQPDPPPSEEIFVELYESGGWHPYDGLEGRYGSLAEQLEVEEQCPPWVQAWMEDPE